ncbi:MAG: toll/interleukin-1 receptor domain-containing protein [Anaerolineae bacterium]
MSQIFISYSSKSKDVVASLAQDIESAGHQIWFDHKLTGGQAWWDQILESIRKCDLFVFALTPEALDSYPCQLEYTYAYQLGKNILPILVANGVSINLLPPELTTIQFVDYRTPDRQAAFRLMSAFTNVPPPKSLPDPLPTPPPVPISYIGNLKEQIDSSKGLSFDEQASLVLKLKEHLRNDDNRPDAVTLLERLKRRDDLFAKIEKEIDAVLTDAGVSSVPHKPAQPTPRAVPPKFNKIEQHQSSEQIVVPRISLWLILQVALPVAMIWGLAFGLIHNHLNWYGYSSLDKDTILVGVLAYIISGIIVGLVLRRVENPPRSHITVGWILSTVLMGGPLNALFLRRVVPNTDWRWILLGILGGIIGWGVSWIAASLIMGVSDVRYSTDEGTFLWGILTGALGTLPLFAILAWMRRAK